MGYQHKEKVCDPVRTLRFSPSFCYFLKIAISHHRFYSHTYMTIVGLDFCPPLNAAERVSLYHWVSPLNHQLSHTRIDTAFLLGYTHATGVLFGYTQPRIGYIRG